MCSVANAFEVGKPYLGETCVRPIINGDGFHEGHHHLKVSFANCENKDVIGRAELRPQGRFLASQPDNFVDRFPKIHFISPV